MTQPERWVVVPAFQAAATLADVVTQSRNAATVLVVDDGSTDSTEHVARGAGAVVVRHVANQGKGAALRTGIARALADGATHIATLDADGQHDPSALPRLFAALDDTDVVIGARARGGSAMPVHRRFTNHASSTALSLLAGVEITDAQSGFRAFGRRVAEAVRPAGNGYEFETEFLVLAARAGFRISSVPVPTIYGAPSHFRLIKDGAKVVRTIWAFRK